MRLLWIYKLFVIQLTEFACILPLPNSAFIIANPEPAKAFTLNKAHPAQLQPELSNDLN
jgi:hypothetical protein